MNKASKQTDDQGPCADTLECTKRLETLKQTVNKKSEILRKLKQVKLYKSKVSEYIANLT
jgi:hypothetical protein